METDRALRLVHEGTPEPKRPGDIAPPTALHPVPRHPLERLNAVRLLSLDACGRAMEWINWQEAACLYARDAVAWTLGDPCLRVHGGINRVTGERSTLDLPPIIAARGQARSSALDPTPALTNPALFARDSYLCMYCGEHFPRPRLTRDHVQPVSKGGRDIWENVVSACFRCNSRKGNRTPHQANMPLLAVPFRPSWIEHLILSNRHILADQMAFLRQQLPRNTRLTC
ncbi:HNH endonuclease [Lysobacter sp. SG-8]|uniref:HNH endonuclease n=1 Tax=Marilutibacter penaei TaxID=2759900 RepID=A0A7W3YF37_9GAMM|nr:HNH endonuclease [Lysobacter penaei]MBB1089474.1 HNH endonuclease [Lysobacter penaei]